MIGGYDEYRPRPGAVRDNLRLARPGATDEQLAEAAARVRLLDWIESLPLRWDTPVGTHGAALPGGQRQRLAVARALLDELDQVITLEGGKIVEQVRGSR